MGGAAGGELAAATVKPVTLELGGKSPNVILDDADLEQAIRGGMAGCYLNSGPACNARSRMLVPRLKLAEAERIAVAESFTPGDPFDEATRLGPLVSATQRERVRGYIAKGLEEGARLLTGGAEPPEGLDRGYFVRPTVFSDVCNDMTIARRLRAGQVQVDGGAFNPLAPFGGYKQSGHGRELGRFAIEEFLTTTSLQY